MRKLICALLVSLCLMALAFPGMTASPTTLTFWTFQELHKAFMDDAVETWNKQNPKGLCYNSGHDDKIEA